MKKNILVYKNIEDSASISQISVNRSWMDETSNKHAYQCLPVSIANTLGWGISFPEDISFIWDGISDTTDSHVQILSGHKYCSTARGNATISFNTYLNFKTDENVTTLIMPVPNEFNDYAQCFTSLISTSFYKSMLPIAWKITKPNEKIIIPAGTPIASIIPISLTSLQDFQIEISTEKIPEEYQDEIEEDMLMFKEMSKLGKFTQLYRKAMNSRGDSVGKHELKKINLRTMGNNND